MRHRDDITVGVVQPARVGARVAEKFEHIHPAAKKRQGGWAGKSLLWNGSGCHKHISMRVDHVFFRNDIKSNEMNLGL